MAIREKINKMLDYLNGPLALTVAYSILTFGANLGVLATSAGLESLLNESKQKREATLLKKGKFPGFNTKSNFVYGEFRLDDGTVFRASDGLGVLDGKLTCNSIIPGLKEGKTYEIETRKSSIFGYNLGEKIINAEDVNGAEQ